MKTTSTSMTMPDPALIAAYLADNANALLIGIGAVIGCAGLAFLAFIYVRRQRRREAAAAAALGALQSDIGAMCASIAGFGERLVRIEQQVRSVSERQDQVELRSGGERSYSHAIRMVHKGADVDELVTNCGINRGEAELLLRVHRAAQAG